MIYIVRYHYQLLRLNVLHVHLMLQLGSNGSNVNNKLLNKELNIFIIIIHYCNKNDLKTAAVQRHS